MEIDSIEKKIANELRLVNRTLPDSAIKLSEFYNQVLRRISELEMDNFELMGVLERYKRGYEEAVAAERILRANYVNEINPESPVKKLIEKYSKK